MINCEKFSLYISEYLDGELSQEICKEIIEHIEICPECKKMHYVYSRIITFCHHCCEIPVPKNVHEELLQALHLMLEHEPKKKTSRKRKP
jgi:anti-sigma factor RsiW